MWKQAVDLTPASVKTKARDTGIRVIGNAVLNMPDPYIQYFQQIAADPRIPIDLNAVAKDFGKKYADMLLQDRLAELRLVREKLPKTVVIIPDGNRRYGVEHKLTIEQAHDLGARVLYEGLKVFEEFTEVENIVLWGWSTDNEIGRPKSQKLTVLNTMAKYLDLYTPELKEKNIRIKHVGRTDRLEPEESGFADSMSRAQDATKDNTGTTIYLAVDYGEDYEDMLYSRAVLASGLTPDELSMEMAAEIRTRTMCIPEPDLIVRTSGEYRLSKFPYGTHAELVFVKTKLPAILPHQMADALIECADRDVRKGR